MNARVESEGECKGLAEAVAWNADVYGHWPAMVAALAATGLRCEVWQTGGRVYVIAIVIERGPRTDHNAIRYAMLTDAGDGWLLGFYDESREDNGDAIEYVELSGAPTTEPSFFGFGSSSPDQVAAWASGHVARISAEQGWGGSGAGLGASGAGR